MDYRPLGSSGLMVSAVGIGCNAFGRRVDQDGVGSILAAARDSGVTLLDTADIYGGEPGQSESMLGEALRGQRDEFVLATKFGMDMQGANGQDFGALGSRRYVRRAVEASLRRLQTDHIDLYQLHRPDPLTPIEETLEALTDLVREGKVLYVGCSNFDGWQVADASWTSSTAGLASFVSVQNEYSLLDRSVEDEVTPRASGSGSAYSRSSRWRVDCSPASTSVEPPHRRVRGPRWRRTARAGWRRPTGTGSRRCSPSPTSAGVELLDVAIGGLAAQPAVSSVIAGATSAEQVTRNARAAAGSPPPPTSAAIDEISTARSSRDPSIGRAVRRRWSGWRRSRRSRCRSPSPAGRSRRRCRRRCPTSARSGPGWRRSARSRWSRRPPCRPPRGGRSARS